MEIIVDDRERAIVSYLEDASHKYNISYSIQRNQIGDYAVIYKGYILLIIERKTWVDLAASIRDGRKHNIQKLLAAREKTGCQLAYLIEGDASPNPSKKIGRFPIKNLRSHLDHLAFRDGIHMIYSKNEEYTAMRLFELAQNYMTLKDIIKEIDELENNGEEKNTLTEKISCSPAINEQILRCLPGIGSIISTILSENNISLHSLYHLQHTPESIASIKYPTGAVIGMEKGTKIAEGTKKIIDSNSTISKKIKVRILTAIPLISKTTADKILAEMTMSNLLNGDIDIDKLSSIKRTEKSKLGLKAAENIFKYLLPCSAEETV